MRLGSSSVLEKEPDISVVGMTGEGESAIRLCAELQPDLVLMDISLTDISGISATRHIVTANPAIKIIAVSTYIERNTVESIMEAGAAGYINKAAGGEELVLGIRTVLDGESYLSRNVSEMLVDDQQCRQPRNVGNRLGRRETEVLKLVVEGLTSTQIATKLFIAVGTVDVHRRNLMHKLDIHSVADLTKYAVREGLVKP
ncbi:MAG: response regulator transcription factor [Proteobacteria bacterium]|nr:response regulator transcription factor [Pseudomonadota bacterium]